MLEHRLQLRRLRRTHLFPATSRPTSCGSSRGPAGSRRAAARARVTRWARRSSAAQQGHPAAAREDLLPPAAAVPSRTCRPGAAPDLKQAASRLAALGYTAPDGALRSIKALTSGVSRRAAIQQALLPVLLDLLADTPDPDGGLLSVPEGVGGARRHAVVPAGAAGRRHGRGAAGDPARHVQAGAPTCWSARPRCCGTARRPAPRALGTPRRRPTSLRAAVRRQPEVERRRRRRLALLPAPRAAAGRVRGPARPARRARGVPRAVQRLGALVAAQARWPRRSGQRQAELAGRPPTSPSSRDGPRLGGAELGYGSDADVLFVCEPAKGVSDAEAV